ncbi:MAG: thiamine-phosphate kinase [Candidatus Omnitrophica bacterium]|nr:thiamine-phosphate kinase [Candidatus Omnitrophota bacterium]
MRTIASLGEVRLIQRMSRCFPSGSSVRVGIGDDAAVLRGMGRDDLLFASDMLIEGVHFQHSTTPAQWVGWKALACNISDIAAMGGLPRWAVVSLGVPPSTSVRWVDDLYRGLARCAKRYDVAIVGGDTVRAPRVVVDVAIVGTVRAGKAILRSGARLGDRIFVTGRLGGSLVSGRHARFTPRLAETQCLIRHLPIHAMIDLSDGLASDLWQIARASQVTLRVDDARIPVSQAGKTVTHALMDGEDFELLFAVPPRAARRVPRSIGQVPVTEIGVVTRHGAKVELVKPHGHIVPLIPTGFKHF